MVINFPYKFCNKAVSNNHHAVQYDKCHIWVHIKCNKINLQTYKFLQKKSFCLVLHKVLLRHCSFWDYFQWGTKIKSIVLTKHHTSPSQDLIEEINEAMDDSSSETVSSKYYEPCELSSLLNNSKNCLSFFELNISSLSFHMKELATLISEHDLIFDIFGVSETKLRLSKAALNSVIIPGYNFETIRVNIHRCKSKKWKSSNKLHIQAPIHRAFRI